MPAPRILLVDEPSVGLARCWSPAPSTPSRSSRTSPAHRADGRAELHPGDPHRRPRLRHRPRQDRRRRPSAEELNNNELIQKFYLGLCGPPPRCIPGSRCFSGGYPGPCWVMERGKILDRDTRKCTSGQLAIAPRGSSNATCPLKKSAVVSCPARSVAEYRAAGPSILRERGWAGTHRSAGEQRRSARRDVRRYRVVRRPRLSGPQAAEGRGRHAEAHDVLRAVDGQQRDVDAAGALRRAPVDRGGRAASAGCAGRRSRRR